MIKAITHPRLRYENREGDARRKSSGSGIISILRSTQRMAGKLGFTTLLFPALLFSTTAMAKSRPNIVLILADDMGYSDIGCFGSEISTPNLDKLASQGVRFSQFYNASRCCPTRSSLLTGLYQHQAGVGDMVSNLGYPTYQGYLNNTSVTIAEVLKIAGYNTFMSGKWHVGNRPETLPVKRGFDRYFGLIDGAGSYFDRIPYRVNQQAPRWMLDQEDFNPPGKGFYMTDAITDYALRFLKESKPDKKPFFLYMAFTAPHWPLHALPEDIARYRGKYLMGWDNLRQERFLKLKQLGLINSSCALSERDSNVPDWNTLSQVDKEKWDLRMAVYAAMVDRMDQNIGRVMAQLKGMGEMENTIIIFLSDNGGCHESTSKGNYLPFQGETGSRESFDAYEYPWANVSNTPFRMHKHWVHEGGISTPFLIHYPAEVAGNRVVTETTGHIVDLMPTLLDYAGATYPAKFKGKKITPMEGISLRETFRGIPNPRTKPLFWEHEGNRAIRDGNWKLVSIYDTREKKFSGWELYDLSTDRSELNDLSKTNPAKAAEMAAQFELWAKRVGVISKEILDKNK